MIDDVAPIQDFDTASKTFSISGADLVNAFLQNEYRGFLISSMNVISNPH
jgi:hypothetical protein